MSNETFTERKQRERSEQLAAEMTVAAAAHAVRAAIATLEQTWSVVRSGLEVIPPPRADPFTPYRVCLERSNGCEHKVVAYPAANDETDAIRLAEADCRAGRAAYGEEGRKLVETVLREHGAWDAHNRLRRLRLIEEHEAAERCKANEPPVAKIIAKAHATPPAPVSFSDEGKRAAAPSRSGDVVQVLSKPPAKQAPRVHNIEAPDDETLAERARARANKW